MNTLKHQQKKQSGDNHKASGKNVVDKKCNRQNMQKNKKFNDLQKPFKCVKLMQRWKINADSYMKE